MLPWNLAALIWKILTAGCFIAACWLAWSLGARFKPRLSAVLIFFLLVNSEVLLFTGNPAGLVIGLTVFAAWCFVENRAGFAGALCLAVALVLKPHDSGPVWLFFLLAGGPQRRRAVQALGLALVLGLLAILWVSQISPHWIQELHANLSLAAEPGGRDDAGPRSASPSVGGIISLQTAVSLIRDNAQFYNPVVYLVCAVPLAIWAVKTLRSGVSSQAGWYGLAAIAALGLLPLYHRTYDAKLLLLTVPACALLWSRGTALRWWALLLTTAAFISTADLGWVLMVAARPSPGVAELVRASIPISLLILGVFYLWIYIGPSSTPAEDQTKRAIAAQ
jgi:hypothetical protein